MAGSVTPYHNANERFCDIVSDCGMYSCGSVLVSREWRIGDDQVAVAVHVSLHLDTASDGHGLAVKIRAGFRRGGEAQGT